MPLKSNMKASFRNQKSITPQILLGDEIMMEILSWLPVKSLLQLKCVSKWFHSLISDPFFAKLHLQRSPQCDNILFTYQHETLNRPFLIPYPLQSLLENQPLPPIADALSRGFDLNVDQYEYGAYGTCNGLVCLYSRINNSDSGIFCVWNPATKKIFQDPQSIFVPPKGTQIRKLGLGYDNLTDTYKLVVVFATPSSEDVGLKCATPSSEDVGLKCCGVKVRSLSGDNTGWRNIQSFPANLRRGYAYGEYLNSALNWIAVAHDDSEITFGKLVIVSLHFGSETFTKLLLPNCLDGVYIKDFHPTAGYGGIISLNLPRIGVMKDCLSLFLRNYKTNHFAIWQMKEFGNQKSWTQLFNILIPDLQFGVSVRPLCIFQNGCVLMIHKFYKTYDRPIHGQFRAVIYDGRDNTFKHSEISSNISFINVKYVQSLVSPRR